MRLIDADVLKKDIMEMMNAAYAVGLTNAPLYRRIIDRLDAQKTIEIKQTKCPVCGARVNNDSNV